MSVIYIDGLYLARTTLADNSPIRNLDLHGFFSFIYSTHFVSFFSYLFFPALVFS